MQMGITPNISERLLNPDYGENNYKRFDWKLLMLPCIVQPFSFLARTDTFVEIREQKVHEVRPN